MRTSSWWCPNSLPIVVISHSTRSLSEQKFSECRFPIVFVSPSLYICIVAVLNVFVQFVCFLSNEMKTPLIYGCFRNNFLISDSIVSPQVSCCLKSAVLEPVGDGRMRVRHVLSCSSCLYLLAAWRRIFHDMMLLTSSNWRRISGQSSWHCPAVSDAYVIRPAPSIRVEIYNRCSLNECREKSW